MISQKDTIKNVEDSVYCPVWAITNDIICGNKLFSLQRNVERPVEDLCYYSLAKAIDSFSTNIIKEL